MVWTKTVYVFDTLEKNLVRPLWDDQDLQSTAYTLYAPRKSYLRSNGRVARDLLAPNYSFEHRFAVLRKAELILYKESDRERTLLATAVQKHFGSGNCTITLSGSNKAFPRRWRLRRRSNLTTVEYNIGVDADESDTAMFNLQWRRQIYNERRTDIGLDASWALRTSSKVSSGTKGNSGSQQRAVESQLCDGCIAICADEPASRCELGTIFLFHSKREHPIDESFSELLLISVAWIRQMM